METIILGIESSCDDTSASIFKNNTILSNVIANQNVHKEYGGVVPELASRAHQQNIVPVVHKAIKDAGIKPENIKAVAFTRGPGLMGSLLVGTSFAKGFALAGKIPLIEVDHLHAHVMVHFIKEEGVNKEMPKFPFLCLMVSGGNSQIILMHSYLEMEIIGQTIDDAAGEAFDKCGKVMGLPYPAGPIIDKLAENGNPNAFKFNKPKIKNLDYSFSGLKTSFLYFIRDQLKENPDFISQNINDLAAAIQKTIVEILMEKLIKASRKTGINTIALAGGVSANSALRKALINYADEENKKIFIPKLSYTTDNAAMIAITAYYKYLKKEFAPYDLPPYARNK